MDILKLLSTRHQDWLQMALSFGLPMEDAEDLVQDMYIKMYNFSELKKIQYGDNDVNTFYVYITMRNLFYDGKKSEISTVDIDNIKIPEDSEQYDKEALEVLLEKMDHCIEDMHWYNKKMFEIYYGKGETIRQISEGAKISSSSIFNTIKNAREKIQIACEKEYQDYTKQNEPI